MTRLLCLLAILATITACGDTEFITKDIVTDLADCYERTETDKDTYLVVLDKVCTDFAISGIVPPQPQPPPSDDWRLLSELPIKENQSDKFHVWRADSDKITQAFVDGYDFLFVIEKRDPNEPLDNVYTQQFHLRQPTPHEIPPPNERTFWNPIHRFHYPAPALLYEFKGWRSAYSDVDRTQAGWTFEFNISPVNNGYYSPTFQVTADGFIADTAQILKGTTLKIFIR